jgi:hypothetical protein
VRAHRRFRQCMQGHSGRAKWAPNQQPTAHGNSPGVATGSPRHPVPAALAPSAAPPSRGARPRALKLQQLAGGGGAEGPGGPGQATRGQQSAGAGGHTPHTHTPIPHAPPPITDGPPNPASPGPPPAPRSPYHGPSRIGATTPQRHPHTPHPAPPTTDDRRKWPQEASGPPPTAVQIPNPKSQIPNNSQHSQALNGAPTPTRPIPRFQSAFLWAVGPTSGARTCSYPCIAHWATATAALLAFGTQTGPQNQEPGSSSRQLLLLLLTWRARSRTA